MEINKSLDGLTLKAESSKNKQGEYIITGKIEGDIEVECVKCLKPFSKHIEEDVKFKIVKPPFNGFDEEYDIIEQEKLDIDEILKSEIESIKADFSNVCESCKNKEFNQEF